MSWEKWEKCLALHNQLEQFRFSLSKPCVSRRFASISWGKMMGNVGLRA